MIIMKEYYERIFDLTFETVRKLAKTNPDINNVLKGFSEDCFVLMADFKVSKEIIFAYIKDSHESPGVVLKLQFKEKHFYDYLLIFSTEICKENKKREIVGVYNIFINFLRTFLGTYDIEPIFSDEFKDLPKGGSLFIAGQFEIIKSVDRTSFYRRALGKENYIDLKENTEYVYIMLNKDDTTFKIGQSKKPRYREATLQSKEPQIVLLKVWECDKRIEKQLHKIYSHKRHRGEWFKLDFGDLCEFDEMVNNLKGV